MSSKQVLRSLKQSTDLALKKQAQEGLAKVFDNVSCKGVANQIRKGKNVVGNVEYGIRMCIHDQIGPKVNVETNKFIPQSKESKVLERRFINVANQLLSVAGYPSISSDFVSDLQRKDREFERRVRERRK